MKKLPPPQIFVIVQATWLGTATKEASPTTNLSNRSYLTRNSYRRSSSVHCMAAVWAIKTVGTSKYFAIIFNSLYDLVYS